MEAQQAIGGTLRHLQVLHTNPFILASAFVAFFEALGEKEKSLLLSYLVLPLVLYPASREFLQRAKSSSSIRTMLKQRERIHGLEARVKQYRKITNTTTQFLESGGGITIDSRLCVVTTGHKVVGGPSLEGVEKAAHRLGVLFHPYEVPTVFVMLGVMFL